MWYYDTTLRFNRTEKPKNENKSFKIGALSEPKNRKLRKNKAENQQNFQKNTKNIDFTSAQIDSFRKSMPKKEVAFTGNNFVSTIANLRTVDKMAISDGGLTVGRVSTSRNKDEAYVNAFRMIGSMILNFVTPVYIAKALDKFANKTFGINVNLDPLILNNKDFISEIKENKVELPKSTSAKDLLDFIDNKPEALFSKFAQQMKKVTYLESGYRDPRKFVDIDDLAKFRTEFENFVKSAQKSKNIENFAKNAKFAKCFNILANVGISSFLLAGVLPKLQYGFNKLVTGSYTDPGLRK